MSTNDPEAATYFARVRAELAIAETRLMTTRIEGEAALRRLLPIAQGDTGQSGRIARFLLGCYNGPRFPFDLTELRGVDTPLFEDCIAVLRMDASPQKEVHEYFANGGAVFEQLAHRWGGALGASTR